MFKYSYDVTNLKVKNHVSFNRLVQPSPPPQHRNWTTYRLNLPRRLSDFLTLKSDKSNFDIARSYLYNQSHFVSSVCITNQQRNGVWLYIRKRLNCVGILSNHHKSLSRELIRRRTQTSSAAKKTKDCKELGHKNYCTILRKINVLN